MEEFTISVRVDGEMGVLEWAGAITPEALEKGVSLAADDALIGRGLRRVEVSIPDSDRMAIRALHRAGFRREGRRRQAFRSADGDLHDVLIYGRLAVDQVYGPGAFSAVMDTVLPTKRIIGHVLFTDEDGRVLLLQTNYKSDWELPGGVVEPGETPREGAVREVMEEIGIEVVLSYPSMIDWMPPYLGWSDAIEFIYLGGVLDPAAVRIAEQPTEIHSAHWVSPDAVAGHVSELTARRIALLLEGPVGFTHNGYLI